MDITEQIKTCNNCKYFSRHCTIAENKLSLTKTNIGTCKLARETNLQYVEADNHTCNNFEPMTHADNYNDILNELKLTAKNLDYALWVIKEEMQKQK